MLEPMKTILIGVVLALPLAAVAVSYQGPSQEFSFERTVGEGRWNYRCTMASTPAETQGNAEYSHTFLENGLREIGSWQGSETKRILSDLQNPNDTISVMEEISAEAKSKRSALMGSLRAQFGCSVIIP